MCAFLVACHNIHMLFVAVGLKWEFTPGEWGRGLILRCIPVWTGKILNRFTNVDLQILVNNVMLLDTKKKETQLQGQCSSRSVCSSYTLVVFTSKIFFLIPK